MEEAQIRGSPPSTELKEIYESMQIVQQLVYLYGEMTKCGLSLEAQKVKEAIAFILSKIDIPKEPS